MQLFRLIVALVALALVAGEEADPCLVEQYAFDNCAPPYENCPRVEPLTKPICIITLCRRWHVLRSGGL